MTSVFCFELGTSFSMAICPFMLSRSEKSPRQHAFDAPSSYASRWEEQQTTHASHIHHAPLPRPSLVLNLSPLVG
jgi:hypothetical protein